MLIHLPLLGLIQFNNNGQTRAAHTIFACSLHVAGSHGILKFVCFVFFHVHTDYTGFRAIIRRHQVLNVLAGCSRDAMSAQREHVALVAKQSGGGNAGAETEAEPKREKGEALPHPGDEGSLRRWEKLLKSVDVNGGRWRSDVLSGGFHGGCSGRFRGGDGEGLVVPGNER